MLVTMCVGLFLVQLDATAVNVALPAIGADLHASVSGLQWVVAGYLVPFAALLLAVGTLGDRYGHRRVVIAGLLLFAAGSAACAIAPNTGMLIAGRAVQGIGGAA
ncbi:MFS transporter, partial [Streptomyces goshikiensis]